MNELNLQHSSHARSRVNLNRCCFIAVVVIAALLSGLATGASHAQVERQQSIMNRARRINARPIFIRTELPVFIIDNKPDVDLRPEINSLGIAVRPGQAPRGTCSVFAMTFLLEYMYGKNFGVQNADFSEEYLNLVSNLAVGQKVDGGFFDQIDLGYQKFGIVDEALLPYKSAFDPNLMVRAET